MHAIDQKTCDFAKTGSAAEARLSRPYGRSSDPRGSYVRTEQSQQLPSPLKLRQVRASRHVDLQPMLLHAAEADLEIGPMAPELIDANPAIGEAPSKGRSLMEDFWKLAAQKAAACRPGYGTAPGRTSPHYTIANFEKHNGEDALVDAKLCTCEIAWD